MKAIAGAVEIKGSDSQAKKEKILEGFADGKIRVLVTKSAITGFGLNWQFCHRQIFVGLTDSYEQIHQAVRRLWRFGQTRPVTTYLLTTDAEQLVRDNIERKSADVNYLKALMRTRMALLWDATGFRGVPQAPVERDIMAVKYPEVTVGSARLINGDCVTAMDHMMEADSIDLALFSPLFGSLYRYSDDARDLSNCRGAEEFATHVRHFARALYRVIRPGRIAIFHVMNVVNTKAVHGFASLQDTRGLITSAMLAEGFALHSEIAVYRDPVQALIQTKSPGLFYHQFLSYAAICRQSLPDYLVAVCKPGINKVPITHDSSEYTLDDWKRMAACVWHVRHSDVIKHKKALAEQAGADQESEDGETADEEAPVAAKHPTPLALPLIQDVVALWSNPGETVLDPFGGYGSTGLVCKEKGRAYVGIELNPMYYRASMQFV